MTDRISLDALNSDQLDALYARAEQAEAQRDQLRARAEDWKQAAGASMKVADELRTERDALAAGVPLICSDERHKTKVFTLELELQRLSTLGQTMQTNACKALSEAGWARHNAETTTDQVRALAETWRGTTVPLGTSINRWWDARLVELNTALEPPAAP